MLYLCLNEFCWRPSSCILVILTALNGSRVQGKGKTTFCVMYIIQHRLLSQSSRPLLLCFLGDPGQDLPHLETLSGIYNSASILTLVTLKFLN